MIEFERAFRLVVALALVGAMAIAVLVAAAFYVLAEVAGFSGLGHFVLVGTGCIACAISLGALLIALGSSP